MKNNISLFYIAIFLIALIATMPLAYASTLNLVYDANGNLITGDGKYREYNGFNKLVRVRDGNNATGNLLEEYMWEADKDKVLVKHVYENNTWKESVYYPSQTFLMVKNASGTFKYKYIYQNGQLVAFENYDGKKFFILGDHKGSASVITNESGAKVEETFYEPFGKVISGGAVSRFSYEGKELSSVLGDYDFHARKYEPDLKVLTQPDMNIPDVYNPQDLNRYTFERNNPAKYEDKDGKNPAIALMLVGFVMGTLSYAIEHAGQVPFGEQLLYETSTAVVHGGIGAAAGLATGLTFGTATAGVGHIAARTLGAKALRTGIGQIEYTANKALDKEKIDPWEMFSTALFTGLLEIPGSKPGTFYSATQLTTNSFISSQQYAWSNGVGLIVSAAYNVYRQMISYNLNANQAARATGQAARQAEQLANSGSNGGSSNGGSGGGGGYSWGVENIGGRLEVIVVQPIR